MTWLVPSALAIAGVAAAIAVALHFIARSRPLAEPLPTTRFIPVTPVHARARAMALTDLVLLVVRVAALAAIGLAVAGPLTSGHGGVTRIILFDHSRAVANLVEARDSVRAAGRAGDIVIPFDSAARNEIADRRIGSVRASDARGSLSAALARAIRVAATLPSASESVDLVLVSPLAEEEFDPATLHIRAAWPGRVRLIRVRAAPAAAPPTVSVTAPANDAVAAGLSLMGVGADESAANATVRVVRGALAAADSAWARVNGHALVHWPASEAFADWPSRQVIDAVGGVTSSTGTMVARLPRVWTLDGDAVARWTDGTAAAVEHRTGGGCTRDVGIVIDEASDLTLHAPFRSFASALLAPCGAARAAGIASAPTITAIAGSGSLAPTVSLRDRDSERSPWSPWLLALGALLLTVELAIRRSAAPHERRASVA